VEVVGEKTAVIGVTEEVVTGAVYEEEVVAGVVHRLLAGGVIELGL